jgi:type II secretory pathway component PulJ
MRKISGFSLLELLITSSLFLILMLVIFSSFRTGVLGYKNIDKAIDSQILGQRILEMLNLDLRNAFAYSESQTKFQGAKNHLAFLAVRTEALSFISYKLEGDRLFRLSRKNKESLNPESEAVPKLIATNIEEFALNYAYGIDGDKSLKWQESWDETEKLPQAVKVRLVLKENPQRSFERAIFLPLISYE